MNLFYTILAFALALGILIVFHELGHYFVARWAGVKVLRFSLGFGKPLWVKRHGPDNTEWVVAAFPLGGYVKMLDEREGEVHPSELPRAFNRQSVYRRFAIVLAGPLANFLLAILVFWLLFLVGIPGARPILGPVPVGSAAHTAGLSAQQTIIKINGATTSNWSDVRWRLLKEAVKKNPVILTVKNLDGSTSVHELGLRTLSSEDLDQDFFPKLGISPYRPPLPAVMGEIARGGAASAAGLQPQDKIMRVNSAAIRLWEEFVRIIRANPGKPLALQVMRGDEILNLTLTPNAMNEDTQLVGKIGAGPWISPELRESLSTTTSYGPLLAFGKALEKTWDSSIFTLEMLGRMIIGQVSWKNISGPITIADYAGQSANLGILPYLSFIAAISIGLGIMNLLPIPLLDGGHLMYYMAEIIRGRPPTEQALAIGQQIGIALLLILMTFAFYNDINRLLTG